jgi:DNA-binding MarR family transcriptional regulator
MTTSRRRGAGDASEEADRPLAQGDYAALAEFRYYLRRFLDFSQRAARDFGLTPQQHQALLSIMGKPGGGLMTISELADHLLIKHHSAVELADRLETLGLVQRQTDETDRRRVLLSLTAAAQDLLARMSSVHLEELRRIGPQLTALLAGLERDRAKSE